MTLEAPTDEWVRAVPTVRKYADGGYGRSAPVLNRPHYSKGAQIEAAREARSEADARTGVGNGSWGLTFLSSRLL